MKFSKFFFVSGLLLLLAACVQPSAALSDTLRGDTATQPIEFQATTLVPSITSTITHTPTATATRTPNPTATRTAISPTPTPTIPTVTTFIADELSPIVTPVGYLADTCKYLENRWGRGKSEPGTIVVPIMFHSIAKPGRVISDATTISTEYFEFFMAYAEELGFSTITMDELVGFLTENEKIPERSMLLILDDRRPGVTELFMPYLEANDWTLTLAWPTTAGTNEELWARMESLAESGRLDVQSHGHDHIYIQDYTPFEEIEEEIYRPIEVIQAHFGTTPSAIIWPGGNFNDEAIQLAQEAGLRFGFTVYSRGPLMFNWIPLGAAEMEMDATLYVLPRYWSTAADVALNQAVAISEAAKQAANGVKADELYYLEHYCPAFKRD